MERIASCCCIIYCNMYRIVHWVLTVF